MVENAFQKLFRAAGFLDDAGLHVVNKYSASILFALADGDEKTAVILSESAFSELKKIASPVTWIDAEARELFA